MSDKNKKIRKPLRTVLNDRGERVKRPTYPAPADPTRSKKGIKNNES